MADGTSGATPSDRVREIEMRLWEEVGTQLKGVTDALKDMTLEMRDVRERLIRIEAQDQPKKIAALEVELREAFDEIARVEREAADELSQAIAAHNIALNTSTAHYTAEQARIEKTAADDKLSLEKRLSRMEAFIAPIAAGGSALLAAVIGAIVMGVSGGFSGN